MLRLGRRAELKLEECCIWTGPVEALRRVPSEDLRTVGL